MAVLRGHRAAVHALAFASPATLVSGDNEGGVRVWDLGTRRPLAQRDRLIRDGVVALEYLPGVGGEGCLLVQGRDGLVLSWDLARFAEDRRAEPTTRFATGCYTFCRFSALGAPATQAQLVALPGTDGRALEIWNARDGTRIAQAAPASCSDSGMCMAVRMAHLPGGEAINVWTGHEDGSIHMWDTRALGASLASARFTRQPVTAIDVAADASRDVGEVGGPPGEAAPDFTPGWRGACSGVDKTVVVFGRAGANGRAAGSGSAAMAALAQVDLPHKPGTSDLRFRTDGRLFATAGWDGRVRLFHAGRSKGHGASGREGKCGRPLASLKHHRGTCHAVRFAPEGSMLASAGEDHHVALWAPF